MTAYAILESPIGPLTLVGKDNSVSGIYLSEHRHRPDPVTFGPREDSVLPQLREQLTAYFEGELVDFDVPVDVAGTAFQQRVWTALREIPYGQTWSYGQLAMHLGQPGAGRAVGLANGRNPVSIAVPCHRVVGSGGALTGYGGGVERKRWLLEHEQGCRGVLFALPGTDDDAAAVVGRA